MHRKQLYLDITICLFLIGDVKTNIKFTLKVIIQGLLRLYNKNISSNLTKTKALLTTSTSKITLNIDGLIIHSIWTYMSNNSHLVYQTYQHTH